MSGSLFQVGDQPVYDHACNTWKPRCPYGDICSGCDAAGKCARVVPTEGADTCECHWSGECDPGCDGRAWCGKNVAGHPCEREPGHQGQCLHSLVRYGGDAS